MRRFRDTYYILTRRVYVWAVEKRRTKGIRRLFNRAFWIWEREIPIVSTTSRSKWLSAFFNRRQFCRAALDAWLTLLTSLCPGKPARHSKVRLGICFLTSTIAVANLGNKPLLLPKVKTRCFYSRPAIDRKNGRTKKSISKIMTPLYNNLLTNDIGKSTDYRLLCLYRRYRQISHQVAHSAYRITRKDRRIRKRKAAWRWKIPADEIHLPEREHLTRERNIAARRIAQTCITRTVCPRTRWREPSFAV